MPRANNTVNKVMLVGRLGRDVELKYTAKGMPYARLSVATSNSWESKTGGKGEKTVWHTVIAWGDIAEGCARFRKGELIEVNGAIDFNEWTDNEGKAHKEFQIKAFYAGEPGRDAPRYTEHDAAAEIAGSRTTDPPITDDDIPF